MTTASASVEEQNIHNKSNVGTHTVDGEHRPAEQIQHVCYNVVGDPSPTVHHLGLFYPRMGIFSSMKEQKGQTTMVYRLLCKI